MIKRILKSVTCLALLAVFAGCASTQKHETAGQYVDDSVITTKVKSAIYNESTLKMLQISVKTEQGVVRLSGYVDSAQSISKAGEVARGVLNVASVRNDLIVK